MAETGTGNTGSSAFDHVTLSGATAAAYLEEQIQSGALKPCRAMVLSADMTPEVETLARHGFHVTVVDPDRARINALKKAVRPGTGKLVFIEDEVFRTRATLYGTVDLVVDRTYMPTLEPIRRADWSFSVGRFLHSDGRFLGLFPIGRDESGPPYSISAEDLRKALERLFVTELLEPAGDTAPGETRGWKGNFRRK